MAPVAPICRDCLARHVFSVQGRAFLLQTLAYNHGTCWQVLKAQRDRDQSVCNLVLTMESVYSFVEAIQLVPDKLEILEEVIVKILKQTVECAIFIREYTGHGFGGDDYIISCDVLIINACTVHRSCEDPDDFENITCHQGAIEELVGPQACL